MKVWLATIELALGLAQLLIASRIYKLLHFPPRASSKAGIRVAFGFGSGTGTRTLNLAVNARG